MADRRIAERVEIETAEAPEGLMGRREFTAASVMALLSGVAITLTGCGGGGGSSPSSPTAPSGTGTSSGDKVATISANHGHVAVLTGAAITAANAVTLNIQGSADHPHSVSLSAAEVQQAGAGQRVSKLSTTEAGHDHTVTFN